MKPYPALLLCIGIGFLVSWLLGYVVIPWLHKLKFGVTIRADGPNWHKNKTGTPTMGGFLFIVGSLVSLAIVLVTDKLMGGDLLAGNGYDSDLTKIKVFGGLIMAAAYGIVGFADDYVKVIKKRNE
ncbi:MAG: phospho-N-acetylmuramoyl-pentapeptide-transferase, partial [Clostridia bacterium]|nr:phospho-N-acetylmuramoyl-pentapeptide-transferase [Clostridia bacterium]